MSEWCPEDGVASLLHTTKSRVEGPGSCEDPLAIKWLDSPQVPELRLPLMDVDACMNPHSRPREACTSATLSGLTTA